jgi:hypothetical protein
VHGNRVAITLKIAEWRHVVDVLKVEAAGRRCFESGNIARKIGRLVDNAEARRARGGHHGEEEGRQVGQREDRP